MGNTDFAANQKLTATYTKHVNDFLSQTPLFHVEDITFPLSTKGARIVDATGRRVKLAGGNWSGGHMIRHCVDGLECRPLKELAWQVRYKFKMNCIRLTYSLQLFFDNNVIDKKYLSANPQMIGMTAMQVMDHTIKVLTQTGLMVILNNHTSKSQWCCSNDDGDGLWWSYEYPECCFFECAQKFALRYKDNPRVIGTDIRNEIRKAHGLEGTWGSGDPLTDWLRAAKICAQKTLAIAPHWLIIIGGLNYQLDLTPIHQFPISLSVPNKLILSGHFYSFSWPAPGWSVSYESFKKKFYNSQTFVRGLGYPYFLGEFGNNQQDTFWKYTIRYLKQTDIDWTYWPLDGFKCTNKEDETYGIWTRDFKDIRNPQLLKDLKSVSSKTPFPKNVHQKGSQLVKKIKGQTEEDKSDVKSEGEKEQKKEQLPDLDHRAKSEIVDYHPDRNSFEPGLKQAPAIHEVTSMILGMAKTESEQKEL